MSGAPPDPVDVVVLGQVGRDLVLAVGDLPSPGGSAPARHRWEGLGGKGANQAVAAAQLGARPALVGVVGADAAGADALAQARADGIDVSAVVERAGARTALLLDLVAAGGERRLVEDVPEQVLLRPADVRAAAPLLAAADVVLLQLQQPADALAAALELVPAGALVVADGAVRDAALRPALLRRADVLRADDAEAEQLVGRPLPDPDAVAAAARELRAAGPRVVVAGAGAHGQVVATAGGCEVVPLVDVERTDPTGAGDAFTATLALALHRREPVAAAARLATAAAALTVQRLGGRPQLSRAGVAELAARLSG
ncbi:PfkB family carbohydrate kinase [Kineococcus sp. SYSU DK006]|uniref:PfkB family carbohydrate kinase n=1 Tax=Kineococcus sp. SYSU DK006 TaxID=3383127 RepID=UPI003D7D8AFB